MSTTSALTIRSNTPSPAEFKAARLAVHISQEDAARAVGVSRLTIFRYEAGQTVPRLVVAKAITRVYKTFLKAVAA